MRFSFHNTGCIHFFKPFKIVYDIREHGGKQTALQFHKKLVKLMDDPSVYILDNRGFRVEVK